MSNDELSERIRADLREKAKENAFGVESETKPKTEENDDEGRDVGVKKRGGLWILILTAVVVGVILAIILQHN